MHVSTDDPLVGLGWLGLWLAIIGLIVGAAFWWNHRRGNTSFALDIARMGAMFYLTLAAIGLVTRGVQLLGRTDLDLSDDVFRDVESRADFLLSSVCTDDFGEASLLCGSLVGPIPFGPRLLVFIGTAISIMASGAIAWAIHRAAVKAAAQHPFDRSVSRTFGAVAIIVAVCSTAGELLTQVGLASAARALPWDPEVPALPYSLDVPLWPFAVAAGLYALYAIFTYGGRLEDEREALTRETEGLV